MSASPKQTVHENMLRVILMITATFAIGSIGFFLAVFLQYYAQRSDATALAPGAIPVEAASQGPSAAEAGATTTNAAGSGQAGAISAETAAKLKILESLQ